MKKNMMIWSNNLTQEELKNYITVLAENWETNGYEGSPEDITFADSFILIQEELEADYELMTDMIEKHEENPSYVVLATIQRWNGTYDGGKIYFDGSLTDIFSDIREDYLYIYLENGVLTVKSAHHDGEDIFQIKELTKRGERFIELHEDDMTERELHSKLFNDRHLSCNPKVLKKILNF